MGGVKGGCARAKASILLRTLDRPRRNLIAPKGYRYSIYRSHVPLLNRNPMVDAPLWRYSVLFMLYIREDISNGLLHPYASG